MGIEHSPPGGRTAGWKVFHLEGTWAKLPHDLEGTDVALGELPAQPLFHLLPPHRHEIAWFVFFRFSVFCIVMWSLRVSGSLSSGQGKSVSTGRRAGKPNMTSNGENFVAVWTSVLIAKTELWRPSSQLSFLSTNATSLSIMTEFCRSTKPLVCGRSVVASVCIIPSDESVSRQAAEVKAEPWSDTM
ncbi:hypothetical protein OUZ56_029802 [Daphnia magna]|uniref:Uncharacterized protein n=1 Tax=Daphnia magna TaxID=35525 RepID=A0ABR0B7W4_9CRUS|nr:hypothetical protein OUZ56_029802 [Daphnia magna]